MKWPFSKVSVTPEPERGEIMFVSELVVRCSGGNYLSWIATGPSEEESDAEWDEFRAWFAGEEGRIFILKFGGKTRGETAMTRGDVVGYTITNREKTQ